MAPIITKECIGGVAVCTTNQRRNQLIARLDTWSRRVGARPTYKIVDPPSSDKYGTGPVLTVYCEFVDAAAADAGWIDISNYDPSFIKAGSFVERYTSREDGETVNEVIPIHRYSWPSDGNRVLEY